MTSEVPPRGAVLHLQLVDLPGSDHTSPDDGTQLAMTQRRRANVARRCWRLTYPDGRSARVGLFVGVDLALEFAREHGWKVARVDREPSGPTVPTAPMAPTGPTAPSEPTAL